MAKKKTAAKPRRAPTRAKTPARAPAKPAPGLAVSIDYPAEGETVQSGPYSIRVSAAGADAAQVRVGDGEWADCRESLGFFWYDWSSQAGQARIAARARAGQGDWSASPERVVPVS